MEEVKKNPLSMQVSMDDFIPASADDKESLGRMVSVDSVKIKLP